MIHGSDEGPCPVFSEFRNGQPEFVIGCPNRRICTCEFLLRAFLQHGIRQFVERRRVIRIDGLGILDHCFLLLLRASPVHVPYAAPCRNDGDSPTTQPEQCRRIIIRILRGVDLVGDNCIPVGVIFRESFLGGLVRLLCHGIADVPPAVHPLRALSDVESHNKHIGLRVLLELLVRPFLPRHAAEAVGDVDSHGDVIVDL